MATFGFNFAICAAIIALRSCVEEAPPAPALDGVLGATATEASGAARIAAATAFAAFMALAWALAEAALWAAGGGMAATPVTATAAVAAAVVPAAAAAAAVALADFLLEADGPSGCKTTHTPAALVRCVRKCKGRQNGRR